MTVRYWDADIMKVDTITCDRVTAKGIIFLIWKNNRVILEVFWNNIREINA